jgi:hypothetical protein
VSTNNWGFDIWNPPKVGAWADNGDGSYTLTGDGSFQPILCGMNVPANSLVYYQVTVEALSGGILKVFSGNTASDLTTTGTFTGQFVAPISNQIGFARVVGSVNATISNVVFFKKSPFSSIIKPQNYDPKVFNDIIRTFA